MEPRSCNFLSNQDVVSAKDPRRTDVIEKHAERNFELLDPRHILGKHVARRGRIEEDRPWTGREGTTTCAVQHTSKCAVQQQSQQPAAGHCLHALSSHLQLTWSSHENLMVQMVQMRWYTLQNTARTDQSEPTWSSLQNI